MNLFSAYTSSFVVLCCIDFLIQLSVYAVSRGKRTEKFYDLTGSITFVILTCISYYWCQLKSFRQSLHAVLVVIWAARLGSYLFTRILKSGHDRRFNEAKKHHIIFFILWILQGFWVFITLLPTLMLMANNRNNALSNRDIIGYILWGVGFLLEVIADHQKATFRSKPENKAKFITSGLWRYSRHPNYLGEIIMWFGLYLSASCVFHGMEFLAVFCPIFDMLLITKVSGIPPLEESGMKRWGHDLKYREYLKKTSVLIPFLW